MLKMVNYKRIYPSICLRTTRLFEGSWQEVVTTKYCFEYRCELNSKTLFISWETLTGKGLFIAAKGAKRSRSL